MTIGDAALASIHQRPDGIGGDRFGATASIVALQLHWQLGAETLVPPKDGQLAVFNTMSAAFSPIMIDGALVFPDVSVGMIEASATRRPAMP